MKNKTKKQEKGITLVALTITIVVMLILAGVTIDVVIDGKLFDNAKTAVNKSNDKVGQVEDEATGLMGTFDEKIEKQEEQERQLLHGTRVTTNTEYKDINGKTAVIPKGFTLSGIASEQTVDGGLVIYDIPASVVMSIDWTNPDSVKTKYNQFVWVPVEISEADTETSVSMFYSADEPYEEGYNGEKEDYAEAVESVYKHGGFYIGRYEAGSTVKRVNKNAPTTNIVVIQDAYPYNFVEWGTSITDIGTKGAVYLSKQLYSNKGGYGVTSNLISGIAWNATMKFIGTKKNVTNSLDWANYLSSTFTIQRGSYCVENGSWTTVNSSYTKPANSTVMLTTGSSDIFCANNIYDLAGNCHEWSLRAATKVGDRHIYGGSAGKFSWSSAGSGASASQFLTVPGAGFLIGFRPVLYIK